jgi:hypothetical protein
MTGRPWYDLPPPTGPDRPEAPADEPNGAAPWAPLPWPASLPDPSIGAQDWERIRLGRLERRRRRHRRQSLLLTSVALVSAGGLMAVRAGRPWVARRLDRPPAVVAPPGRPTVVTALSLEDLPIKPSPRPVPPDAQPMPVIGLLRQLTLDACCAGAWWAPDGQSLRFIDRPPDSPQAAIYAQPIWPPGSLPAVLHEVGGEGGDGRRYVARPQGAVSVVTDHQTGLEWPVDTGGNPVLVAPDGSGLVWFEAPGGREAVDSLNAFHAAGIDGGGGHAIGGLWGGRVLSYLPDSQSVLALGRTEREVAQYSLQRIRTADGSVTELARGPWLSDVALSPDGAWVAFMTSLDREHPEANGVWVAPTDPASGGPRRLEFAGAYRWRDAGRLILIPQLPGQTQNALIEVEAGTGASRLLYEPAQLAIRVANNDWSIAPGGRYLAFRSAADLSIWLVDLGP